MASLSEVAPPFHEEIASLFEVALHSQSWEEWQASSRWRCGPIARKMASLFEVAPHSQTQEIASLFKVALQSYCGNKHGKPLRGGAELPSQEKWQNLHEVTPRSCLRETDHLAWKPCHGESVPLRNHVEPSTRTTRQDLRVAYLAKSWTSHQDRHITYLTKSWTDLQDRHITYLAKQGTPRQGLHIIYLVKL
jgi:hypothetical protein